jgi:hypothetical protein
MSCELARCSPLGPTPLDWGSKHVRTARCQKAHSGVNRRDWSDIGGDGHPMDIDVQVIKSRFAREFWLASRKEAVKSIARAKLAQVSFCTILSPLLVRDILFLDCPYICFSTSLS